MKVMKNKTFWTVFATTLCMVLLSEVGLSQKNKKEDIETITAEANRTIPKAYRIAEVPKIIDTVEKFQETNYSLLALRYNTNIQVDTIKAANISLKDNLSQLYNSYVRLGIGYPLIPLADVYYSNKRSRNYLYGFDLHHLSGFNKIKHYAPANFDRTNGSIYGALLNKNWKLDGAVTGNFRGLHYYGIRDKEVAKDTIAQRYNEFGFNTNFSQHKKDSAHLNFDLGLTYLHFSDKKPKLDSLDKWHAREDFIELTPKFDYKWKSYDFGLDVGLKYNGYRYGIKDSSISAIDSGIYFNNVILSAKPHVTTYLLDNKLRISAGVSLNYDAGIINRLRVYPMLEVKYGIENGGFVPYFVLDGGLKQNSMRLMSYQNEFLLSNQQLRNESTPINAKLGIRGTISNRMGYNVNAQFGVVRDKLLFVNDTLYTTNSNKFRAIYDTMKVAKIEVALYYQLDEKIKIDVVGRYFSYMLNHEVFAWNLPTYQIVFRGSYNLYDKILASLSFDIEGGRKAKVYETGENTIVENGITAKKLGVIYDIDLHLEYRYTTRLSFFIDFNNLAANKYNRWLNYPVYGFQAMVGATFRF